MFFISDLGLFTVKAKAKNRVTDIATVDDVTIIVTEAPCQAPKVGIQFNSTNNLKPVTYFRADQIVIASKMALNCTPVTTTK